MEIFQETIADFYLDIIQNTEGTPGIRQLRRRLNALVSNGDFSDISLESLGQSDRQMLMLIHMIGSTMRDGQTRKLFLSNGETHRARKILDLGDSSLASHPTRFFQIGRRLDNGHSQELYSSHAYPATILFDNNRIIDLDKPISRRTLEPTLVKVFKTSALPRRF